MECKYKKTIERQNLLTFMHCTKGSFLVPLISQKFVKLKEM